MNIESPKKLHATRSLASAFQQRPALFVIPFFFLPEISLHLYAKFNKKRWISEWEAGWGREREDKEEEGNRAKCHSLFLPPPPVKWPSSSCSPDSFLWPVRSVCVCVLPARPELWEPRDLDSRLKFRAGEKSLLKSLTMHRVSHEPKAKRLHSPCVVWYNPPPPAPVLHACVTPFTHRHSPSFVWYLQLHLSPYLQDQL